MSIASQNILKFCHFKMYILSQIHLSNNFLLSIHLSEHNEYMIVDSRHYVLLGGRVVALRHLGQSIIYTNPLHNDTPIIFCDNIIPYFRRCVKGIRKGAPKRSFEIYLVSFVSPNYRYFIIQSTLSPITLPSTWL